MEYKVIVVGIGPGSPDYILPIASRTIAQAQVVVGSKRALDAFAPSDSKTKVIDRDIQGVLTFIAESLMTSDVVVMVSGDPGFYSLLVALRSKFTPSQLTVIPGISSVQLAFARMSEVWQDARLISMHGRKASDEDLAYKPNKKLGILTDHEHNPSHIAQVLMDHGWPIDGQVWLGEGLSYEEENHKKLTLGEARDITGFTHCVMVVMA
ncbi:precorrin-6y C5,15-methyltransferase (decarboxylating) subunit CbiE [Pelosinus sp. sgz500959]|uniref:precorrin-6y C5,15-methyltransferase (decarboxylating) subunit CbiE n=1 Tax=Pelosinus sp. sgz500959 TaxID=3242472 RepID=UPI00366D5080